MLDIGTGPGSSLIPAAERTGAHGLGIGAGIDFGWFKHILPELQKRSLRNTALVQMDATNLGFADGSIDFVLCGNLGWYYCFDFFNMEFTKPDKRLVEISRVLRNGGQIGISSWVAREDIDWFGEQFIRYFPEYVADWEKKEKKTFRIYRENPEGYEIILREGGFQDVESSKETEEFISTDEEEWWGQVWGAYWWEYIDEVAKLYPGKLPRFKEQVFENLHQHRRSDGIHSRKTALFAFGKKKF